jgi:hypothetical protein
MRLIMMFWKYGTNQGCPHKHLTRSKTRRVGYDVRDLRWQGKLGDSILPSNHVRSLHGRSIEMS